MAENLGDLVRGFMKTDNLMSYDDLVKDLSNLPITWYPALIMHMVETAYKKNVFLRGGASNIVKSVEKKLNMDRRD